MTQPPPVPRPAVLVVGAGPTGLAAAHLLGSQGVRVLLVERNATTGNDARRSASMTSRCAPCSRPAASTGRSTRSLFRAPGRSTSASAGGHSYTPAAPATSASGILSRTRSPSRSALARRARATGRSL
ncbi:FAD-dependent monooxygenase [Streptomyces adelaidensis]|uniref:FAD-dependent monooxygenase n=1 Tax=Streptomyces adelaidensis TaxID=2796465 RepID=UPI001F48764C|nr:FAD-dependent monooxygenase [Streptomyces adelaidensis]